MAVTESERRSMAENLHDGALQYILAARMDLEDARELADPARLRPAGPGADPVVTTVALHRVRAASGRAGAVGPGRRDRPARAGGRRAGVAGADAGHRALAERTPGPATTCCSSAPPGNCWPTWSGTPGPSAHVTLALQDGTAELTIADDGVGTDPAVVGRPAGAGPHRAGLASGEDRVGRWRVPSWTRSPTGGTVVRVSVPAAAPRATAGQNDGVPGGCPGRFGRRGLAFAAHASAPSAPAPKTEENP